MLSKCLDDTVRNNWLPVILLQSDYRSASTSVRDRWHSEQRNDRIDLFANRIVLWQY